MIPDLVRYQRSIRTDIEPIEVEAPKHEHNFTRLTSPGLRRGSEHFANECRAELGQVMLLRALRVHQPPRLTLRDPLVLAVTDSHNRRKELFPPSSPPLGPSYPAVLDSPGLYRPTQSERTAG